MKLRLKKLFKQLGPGIITGAADDDPSGIATYSQAGAIYGPAMLWTSPYILPLVYAVQEISARIGLVTGKGIAKNLKEHYPRYILLIMVSLLVIANIINIGADLGAIAAAIQLVLPINYDIVLLTVTLTILALEIFVEYKKYANILKWLTLSLFAYFITAFFVNADWSSAIISSFVPTIKFNYTFLFTVVGILGTTISPYVIFWQANEEVEEEMQNGLLNRTGGEPKISWAVIKKMRIDTFIGMLFSGMSAWFIILTASNTLYTNGVTSIETAAQAAAALEPLVSVFPNSGYLAKVLFSIGIIGTGLLAVPILAASSSYAISEIFGWKEGLNYKLKRARPFYIAIALATFVGFILNYIGVNPIQALIYSAVINAIVSVPLIAMIISIANNKSIMGEYSSPWYIRILASLALLSVVLGIFGIALTFVI